MSLSRSEALTMLRTLGDLHSASTSQKEAVTDLINSVGDLLKEIEHLVGAGQNFRSPGVSRALRVFADRLCGLTDGLVESQGVMQEGCEFLYERIEANCVAAGSSRLPISLADLEPAGSA